MNSHTRHSLQSLAVLTYLASTSLLSGTTLTGILYGSHEAPSVTGSGEIRLAVNGQIYHLEYIKPDFGRQFLSDLCRYAGAIWTVRASHANSIRGGSAKEATCMGKDDAVSRSAVDVVLQFWSLISAHDEKKAYDLFSDEYKQGHSLSEFLGSMSLDFTLYSGQCLEILRNNSTGLMVRSPAECYITRKGDHLPLDFVFNVGAQTRTGKFRIRSLISLGNPRMISRAPSEKRKDELLETAIRKNVRAMAGDYYFYDKVDLNGDGEPEALVYVVSRRGCDLTGCPLLVMRKRNSGYDLVSSVSHTDMPVFVSTNRTTGWNDLIIENEAGDYRVLKFTGSVYPDAMDSPLTAWTDAVGYLSNPRLPMYGVSF